MKKYLIVLFLIIVSLQFVTSEQIENIVLLDTSMSMSGYYSGTIEYLIENIVNQQLQTGDSLHLLSFNDFPEYEISRTIRGELEIRALLNRILLLQPFGKYTDLISAFSYLYEYVDKLPSNSIKKLIILTDGIHDPPPGSPYPVSDTNKADIVKISADMRRHGWDVTLIQFPLNNDINFENSEKGLSKSNERNDKKSNNLFPAIADTLDEEIISFDGKNESINHRLTGAPEIIYPGDLGSVGESFAVDFTVLNHSSEPVLIKLSGIIFGSENFLDDRISLKLEPGEQKKLEAVINLPQNWSSGSYNSTIELEFSDSLRSFPRKGILTFNYDPNTKGIIKYFNNRFILYIIIGIILIFALIYILIKVLSTFSRSSSYPGKSGKSERRLHESGQDPKHRSRHSEPEIFREQNQITIEMVVKNQNRQIGHRNIHLLDKDNSRSVGGDGSEYFLIFIIPTGKRIGEIVLEDDIINFVPKSNEFFPDLQGEKLINCLNKPIRVVNKDFIETIIIFKEWISPSLRLNRVMHLADNKGLPDFKY